MHRSHFHLPRLLLLFFSLLSTVSGDGLSDAQVNLVKQRLQEGATHRLAMSFVFTSLSSTSSTSPTGVICPFLRISSHVLLRRRPRPHLQPFIQPNSNFKRKFILNFYLQLGNRYTRANFNRTLRTLLLRPHALYYPPTCFVLEYLQQCLPRRRIRDHAQRRRCAPLFALHWRKPALLLRGWQCGRHRERRRCCPARKLDRSPRRGLRRCGDGSDKLPFQFGGAEDDRRCHLASSFHARTLVSRLKSRLRC
jgi:hypothetical protein